MDGLPASSATARVVVLEIASGHLLAAQHLDEAARTLATSGSTLKPLLLMQLIAQNRWNPRQTVACNRNLHVAGRALPCAHPEMAPMAARAALAWSCNSYFAAVADHLHPGELRTLLAPTGLLTRSGLASGEAAGQLQDPHTPEQTRLALLGIEDVQVTPLGLAKAYRWLAQQWAAQPQSLATETVRAGMNDAASLGTGASAALGGVSVAGKTGTAPATAGQHTHGWFAALAPAEAPQVVVVVYLPNAHGADAATITGQLLARSPLRGR